MTEGPDPAGSPSNQNSAAAGTEQRWPGWPGDNVYRMIVPVTKVGGIIGKKGDLIKKLCEETRSRVRVLDPPSASLPDRIVLISGKEEPEAEVSPAMEAVLRVFKKINGIAENVGDGKTTTESAICSVRLLVAASQAINLIGKQGTSIKSIQEGSGAVIRVINGDDLPVYASKEERVVDIQGESLKVLKALQAVVGHLRRFLVDHSVVALFEKPLNKPATQDHPVDAWVEKRHSLIHTAQQAGIGNDYPLSLNRDSLFLDRETRLEPQVGHGGMSSYAQDPVLAGSRSSALGRTAGGVITQVTQTMQIPLTYAEDIIGREGANIAYIRRTSGAVLSIQESRGLSDEIVIELKGTPTQVQTAQQLIEESIVGHKESSTSVYGSLDIGARPSFSQLASAGYPSSSLTSQSYGGYGTGLGGYGSYRY
ncbi:RNA-binding KH domain-containing protein PEPPER-like [Iris pallida]|uniref:RNA-binding KH domain-containing protein PEPPER-like n=1 Tax=Iris pallida TaxID=29817 RepID=A0AAX6GCR5_IRIPA|nr:RNA-binding KH domain-containing protein PEPPER-like [Iris pallida]KAJ6826352.1 RNA-binding KH domain-containing protein PEPPER-like [Iris pallida]